MDNTTEVKPTNAVKGTGRVDPLDEVRRILKVYTGPARNAFRMHVGRLLAEPDYQPKVVGLGSVEKDIRRILRMLRGHPEEAAKREAIRQLLA